jgi:hypothetical protein
MQKHLNPEHFGELRPRKTRKVNLG